ncbi:MAG TPA: methylaspartate mutase [Pseudonocardiaceae bacterium]
MTASAVTATVPFGWFVAEAHAAGNLVVQPRMGFGTPEAMRAGLRRTRDAAATTVGTLTLDSYTRVGDADAAAQALATGVPLNGYPITTHPADVTMGVLDGLCDRTFPVQVRHGSARPQAIVAALAAAGLDATEGGPVSYCLPYSRTPLVEAVANWVASCEALATLCGPGREPHLETFGGCLLGQLCPPSMLVAMSLLEALFFTQHGIRSVSLSYAQQTNAEQDEEAVRALCALAAEWLPDVDRHVVIYGYMGVYPETRAGADRLLAASARLAVRAGAARLIVKTTAEACRIPTVDENVAALELAGRVAKTTDRPNQLVDGADSETYHEARALVEAVLTLDGRLAVALPAAFRRGLLDVPFCLHPDNPGRARSHIAADGRLRWADPGGLPLGRATTVTRHQGITSAGLVAALTHVRRTFDRPGPADHENGWGI